MVVLTVTFAFAMTLLGVGMLIEYLATNRIGKDLETPAYDLLTGWASFSLVALIVGIVGAHLTVPLLIVGVFGVVGLSLARHSWSCLAYLIAVFCLVFPLLWIASNIPPTMFDEFSHWLPKAQLLLERDAFPSAAHPAAWFGVHPPALTLISYGVDRMSGVGFESAPKIFSVMLAAVFGLVLAELVRRQSGAVLAIAVGLACATVLNPFFDPRLALTAYADTPTGFVLALCVAAYWRAIEEPDVRYWWRMAAPTVLLLLLRETGVVLAAGLGLGLLMLGRRGWRGLATLLLCTCVTYGLWRLYLISAGTPVIVMPRPPAEWDWGAPWAVARSLLIDRLWPNALRGLAAISLVGVIIIIIVTIIRRADTRLRDLGIMCATITVGWIAFLAWSYVAVFLPVEVAEARSAWRYLSELGPMLIYGCFAASHTILPSAAVAVEKPRNAVWWIGLVACLLVPASILVTWKYWRIDCKYPDVAVLRTVAPLLRAANLRNASMAVVHPTEALGYAGVLDYELHRLPGASIGLTSVVEASQEFLLDLGKLDRETLRKTEVRPMLSLARRDGDTWTQIMSIPSAPVPICSLAAGQ